MCDVGRFFEVIMLRRVPPSTHPHTPMQAPAWPAHPPVYTPSKPTLAVPRGTTDDDVTAAAADSPQATAVDGGRQAQLVRGCCRAACEALLAAEAHLNELDAKVKGDEGVQGGVQLGFIAL